VKRGAGSLDNVSYPRQADVDEEQSWSVGVVPGGQVVLDGRKLRQSPPCSREWITGGA
jgi:hypothetical protein